jgi:hypothetical protein
MALQPLRGNVKVHWFVTDPGTTITQAEVAGSEDILGTDGGEALISIAGFESSPSQINVPNLVSNTTGQVTGETTLGSATLTYYLDGSSNPIRASFTDGEEGWIVLAPNGTANGKTGTKHQVEVQSRNIMYGDVAKWQLALAQQAPVDVSFTA